jgi:hypothetical protein
MRWESHTSSFEVEVWPSLLAGTLFHVTVVPGGIVIDIWSNPHVGGWYWTRWIILTVTGFGAAGAAVVRAPIGARTAATRPRLAANVTSFCIVASYG